MAGFVPISGPVLADTVYINNVLVARDVSLTLPEVSPMTADVQAMGTWTMPVWQLLENLEASITKVGLDNGMISMIKAEPMSIECRIAQSITDANGVTKTIGCKAFMRGTPNKVPGLSGEIGSNSENDITYSLTRYVQYIDGAEMCYIDRLAGICRIGGKDMMGDVNALL